MAYYGVDEGVKATATQKKLADDPSLPRYREALLRWTTTYNDWAATSLTFTN
jgi:hypothetical protein